MHANKRPSACFITAIIVLSIAIVNIAVNAKTAEPARIENRAVASLYAPSGEIDLDSLIGLINDDSIYSCMVRLQEFGGRLAGTDSCYAAQSWITGKFIEFGYDSIIIDTFIGSQLHDRIPVESHNVAVFKPGSRFPDRQLIIGAHYDTYPLSPGADDNASGVTGMLEIARVLSGLETEMTIVFIAFDSEKSGFLGSKYYADSAYERGDNIIYMLSMDMIGGYRNDTLAYIMNSFPFSYSGLYGDLAYDLFGLQVLLHGPVDHSSHSAFVQKGYDAAWLIQYDYNSMGGSVRDSLAYIGFEYLGKLIRAGLATVYVADRLPPPVRLESVANFGDGKSIWVGWLPGDTAQIESYKIYYRTQSGILDSLDGISNHSTGSFVGGLVEGESYAVYVVAVDSAGRHSVTMDIEEIMPASLPRMPDNLQARPLHHGIELTWEINSIDLDLSHYDIVRDGILLGEQIDDTAYIDNDASLGYDFHEYLVVSVDSAGLISDTVGATPIITKAATLESGKILIVNRTSALATAFVDSSVTGQFLRETLADYDYTYIGDFIPDLSEPYRTPLSTMIDYEMMLVAAEGARTDEIVDKGDILEDMTYFMSIGGKVVITGRWGDISVHPQVDTACFTSFSSLAGYHDAFGIDCRIVPRSLFIPADTLLSSDFAGAIGMTPEYPDLIMDSLTTLAHAGGVFKKVDGIPCPSYAVLSDSGIEVIYVYNSSNDSSLTEGTPVGWRSLIPGRNYVFFNFPLSFMEMDAAAAALRQAVNDLGVISSADRQDFENALPALLILEQNHPNPFNTGTVIGYRLQSRAQITLSIYNIAGQNVKILIETTQQAGSYNVVWDGTDNLNTPVASGVYIYVLKSGNQFAARKMLLLK